MTPVAPLTPDRNPDHLHPDARMAWLRLAEAALALGRPIFLTEGYRSGARQDALYAQGRTVPGKIVTAARAGQSWHQTRRAVDFAFQHGSPFAPEHPWEHIGQMAELLGFEWGGRWKRPDRPHLQFTGGLSLAEALAEARTGIAPRGAEET